jgi:hypothetical protein
MKKGVMKSSPINVGAIQNKLSSSKGVKQNKVILEHVSTKEIENSRSKAYKYLF